MSECVVVSRFPHLIQPDFTFRFLRRDPDNTNNMHPPGEIAAPLMAQYLLTLFGREPHDRGDPFTEFLGMPPSSRWGDYVFNQEGWCPVICPLAHLTILKHWTKY
jgi:hypothetical protein